MKFSNITFNLIMCIHIKKCQPCAIVYNGSLNLDDIILSAQETEYMHFIKNGQFIFRDDVAVRQLYELA